MRLRNYKIYKYYIFICVFFAIVSGCYHQDIKSLNFQRDIDRKQNAYQLSVSSFILKDIQTLKKNNISLKASEIRLAQAQNLYQQSFAGYLPIISLDSMANHQRGINAFNNFRQPRQNFTFYSLGLNANLTPDFFSKTRLKTLIADNKIQIDYLTAQANYLNIMNAYAKNYHLICATQSLIDIQKSILKSNQNQVQSLKKRYELGRINVVDYYNAQNNLASAKIDIDKAKQNYNLAIQSYYTLLDKPFDNKTNKKIICKNGFPTLPNQEISIKLQDLDNRPDIQATQYRIKNAGYDLDLSLRAIYPDIDFLFSFQNNVSKISNILDVKDFTSRFVAQLSQVIYDGGLRDSFINVSKLDLELAKKDYHNQVVTAGNDLITLGKNLVLARQLENQAQARLNLTTKALDAANRNYKLGNIDFLTLLKSQQNHDISHIEFISAQHNTRNLYVDLLTASGFSPIGK